jgi:hypothetical protein
MRRSGGDLRLWRNPVYLVAGNMISYEAKMSLINENRLLCRTKSRLSKMDLLIGAMSVSAFALVYLCTNRYGVAVSSDSAHYLSAARNLLVGKGYVAYDGSLFLHWPPLFPTLLALLGLFGLEPLDGARLLNGLSFAFIILASYRLFQKHIRTKGLVVFGCLLVLLSLPVLGVCIFAWSEPVFMLLVIMFIHGLPELLEEQKTGRFYCVSVLAALAFLQRYVGIALVAAGITSIILFTRKDSLVGRCKQAAAFGLIAAAPVAIWIIRNVILSGAIHEPPSLGRWSPSMHTLGANAVSVLPTGWWNSFITVNIHTLGANAVCIARELTGWLLPNVPSFEARMTLLLLALTLVAIMETRACLKERVAVERTRQMFPSIVLITVCIFPLIFLSRDYADDKRLLSPIYVPILFLVLIVVDDMYRRLDCLMRNKMVLKVITLGLALGWIAPAVKSFVDFVPARVEFGAGAFSDRIWMESDLVKWLNSHRLNGNIYTNNPDAMYLLTGLNVRRDTRLGEALRTQKVSYLVWFNIVYKRIPNLEALAFFFEIKPVETLPDGEIYALRARPTGPRSRLRGQGNDLRASGQPLLKTGIQCIWNKARNIYQGLTA